MKGPAVLAVLLVAACSSDTGAGSSSAVPSAPAPGSHSAALAGLCMERHPEFAPNERGYPSVEAAWKAEQRDSSALRTAELDGRSLVLAGEEVGEISFQKASAGGYRVSYLRFCHPG